MEPSSIHPAQRRRELVVIGASAGGVGVLRDIAAGLPAGLPACVLVVLHIGAHNSCLADILDRCGPVPAAMARHAQPLQSGRIFVAPPDHHLLVKDGFLMLSRGAKENHSRPAIDPLMRSAAVWHGPMVIGVLLSGGNDDGTAGLQAISQAGGTVVVQDPEDAEVPFMPASAMRHVQVDHCVAGRDIAATIVGLVGQPAPPAGPLPLAVQREHAATVQPQNPIPLLQEIGDLAPIVCPSCGGSLFSIKGAQPERFRCHTGHAFTMDSLRCAQDEATEAALWTAIRALQEKETLMRRMADLDRTAGDEQTALSFEANAGHLAEQVRLLRALVPEVS
jgi:two-component system chemotaxis response regulator CheB